MDDESIISTAAASASCGCCGIVFEYLTKQQMMTFELLVSSQHSKTTRHLCAHIHTRHIFDKKLSNISSFWKANCFISF